MRYQKSRFRPPRNWPIILFMFCFVLLCYSMLVIYMFQIRRKLKNFEAEQPHTHAIFYMSYLLSEQAWEKSAILDALSGK